MRHRRRRSAVALCAVIAAAACHRRATIASCDDDLGGVYDDPSGERWMILDDRTALEAYPLFDDFHAGGAGSDWERAPRAIDFYRPRLDGDVRRRYTPPAGAGSGCVAKAPARITACEDDRLELVLADPAPCGQQPEETHVERWLRSD